MVMNSCQGAQCGQEPFQAIKAYSNLGRVLGSIGKPLLTAQLMILMLGPRTRVCFPSKAVILLGAVDREVLLCAALTKSKAGFSCHCSHRSSPSARRGY